MAEEVKSVYDFAFKQSDGAELKLSSFRGKVILIVNTASKCLFTKQYDDLQDLYNKYNTSGLVIIGVPSNDFGNQEPGSDEQIQKFCQINYNITFPIVKKERVSGNEAHPFYLWAKKQLGFGSSPKWNFHKYIIDRKGNLVDYFSSITGPDSTRLVKVIEKLLSKPEN